MSEDLSNTATVSSPDKEESQTQKRQESQSSWMEGIGNVTKWLDPSDRLPGAIFLGIIVALILTIWKVPGDKSIWVVLPVIILVLFSLTTYLFFSSSTRYKLKKLKDEKKQWEIETAALHERIQSLSEYSHQLTEKNIYGLNEINRKIKDIHIMIENSEKPEMIIKKILSAAGDIQNQIDANSSTTPDGIDAVVNRQKYVDEWLTEFPELQSKKIQREN